MADVPLQISPTVKVQELPDGYSHVRYTPDAFGAGLAQTMDQTSNMLEKIAREERMDAAASEADNADFVLADKLGELQGQFRQLKGKAPTEAIKAHIDAVKNVHDEIRTTLVDPAAQRLFDAASRRRVDNIVVSAQEYAANQLTQHYVATNELRHKQATIDAANAYDNIKALTEIVLKDVDRNSQTGVKYHGFDGEDLNAFTHKGIVQVLEGALNGALAGDTPESAAKGKALLNGTLPIGKDGAAVPVRQILGGKIAERWESDLDKMGGEKKGLLLGVDLSKRYGGGALDKVTEMFQAGTISDKEYDTARKEIVFRDNDRETRKKRNIENAQEVMYRWIHQNGGDVDAALLSIKPNTPEWSARRVLQATHFEESARTMFKRAATKEASDQLRVDTWLRDNADKASDMSGEEILTALHRPENEGGAGVSPTTDTQTVNTIRAFKNTVVPGRARGRQEVLTQATNRLLTMLAGPFDPNKKEAWDPRTWTDETKKKAVDLYREAVTDFLDSWYAPGNKANAQSARPTDAEVEAVVGPLLAVKEVPAGTAEFQAVPSWKRTIAFGAYKEPAIITQARMRKQQYAGPPATATTLPATPTKPASPLDGIPKSDVARISGYLQTKGMDPTPQTIRKMYDIQKRGAK